MTELGFEIIFAFIFLIYYLNFNCRTFSITTKLLDNAQRHTIKKIIKITHLIKSWSRLKSKKNRPIGLSVLCSLFHFTQKQIIHQKLDCPIPIMRYITINISWGMSIFIYVYFMFTNILSRSSSIFHMYEIVICIIYNM